MGHGLSFFETVARWLRSPVVEHRAPLWGELRSRGAGREIIRFAEPYGADLGRAWLECGRANWCVEIAARVGVGRALVEHSVGDLVRSSEKGGEPAAEAALEAARAFADQRGSIEALVDAVAELCAAVVEAQPDVRAALDLIGGATHRNYADHDAYDQAYEDAQRKLAEVVRLRISAGEVRVALEGLEAHPYR